MTFFSNVNITFNDISASVTSQWLRGVAKQLGHVTNVYNDIDGTEQTPIFGIVMLEIIKNIMKNGVLSKSRLKNPGSVSIVTPYK